MNITNSCVHTISWQIFKYYYSCRHNVFAEYFGDETPPCKKQCDVCKNGNQVQKQIDSFQSKTSLHSRILRLTDDDDLYGGGRKGQKTEREEYYSSDAENNSNETKAKKQLHSFIKKQFEFRKSSQGEQDDEKISAKYARVKAADSTSTKVNGLKIVVSYAHILVKLLVIIFCMARNFYCH